MTMFITGGTSSIGRILVKELASQGVPMHVMVRKNSNRSILDFPEVTFVDGDVNDTVAIRKGMEGCQFVTHMAAIVGHNVPETEWWRVNRDGSRNVLQAAHDLHVASVVQVSSMSVFGYTQPGEMADETRTIDIKKYVNLYQKTKHSADEIAQDYVKKGLSVKIVYPAFGYGCSQATSHPSLQDQTLLRMAAGKPLAIMGSGRNRICLSYYNDTVAGILLAHEKGKAGEGYLLGNDNLTFKEIWSEVAKALGKEAPRMRIPLTVLKMISSTSRIFTGKSIFPSDFFDMIGFDWCFSNRKAMEQLGWRPHSFHDGLNETWKEYQKQGWHASN
jgi:dihydroflavonol-4-reductase